MHKCNAKVSSVGVKQKTLIFDPTSECVFTVQQKQKIAARLKPTVDLSLYQSLRSHLSQQTSVVCLKQPRIFRYSFHQNENIT